MPRHSDFIDLTLRDTGSLATVRVSEIAVVLKDLDGQTGVILSKGQKLVVLESYDEVVKWIKLVR